MAICPQPPFPPFLVVPHSFISCAVRVSRHLPAYLPPSPVSSHSFLFLCVSQLSPQSTWSILIITSLNYPQLPLSTLSPRRGHSWRSTPSRSKPSVQINWAQHVIEISLISARSTQCSPRPKATTSRGREREGERKTEREGCLGSKGTSSRGFFARLHNTLLSISLSLIFFLANCGCPLQASTATATSFVLCDNVAKVSHVASSAELMRTPRARVAPRESPLKRKMCKS